MLIAIDTQRMAEILASYVKARMECEAEGDEENAKVWQDRFDRSTDFLERLGLVAYYDDTPCGENVTVGMNTCQFLG